MIIACPECTQPFQVEDGDIAPLVQVECPHCVFRMILDFEAANDASLIEVGMRMAQGFSTEADYRTAVGAGEIAVGASPAPHLHAVQPEVEPEVELEPAVAFEPQPRMPPTEPASERPPLRQPPIPEAEFELEPETDKPPVRIHRATFEPAAEATPESEPTSRAESRGRPTLIAHTAPPPAQRPPAQSGIPQSVAEPGTPVPIEREVDVEMDFDEPELEAETRSPPHTPPTVAPIARPELSDAAPTRPAADSQSRPIESLEAKPEAKPDKPKASVASTVFKIILLLVLLGVASVMVWSLIETGNPNPLPMLQEKFESAARG